MNATLRSSTINLLSRSEDSRFVCVCTWNNVSGTKIANIGRREKKKIGSRQFFRSWTIDFHSRLFFFFFSQNSAKKDWAPHHKWHSLGSSIVKGHWHEIHENNKRKEMMTRRMEKKKKRKTRRKIKNNSTRTLSGFGISDRLLKTQNNNNNNNRASLASVCVCVCVSRGPECETKNRFFKNVNREKDHRAAGWHQWYIS